MAIFRRKQRRTNPLMGTTLKGLVVLGTLAGIVACSTPTPVDIPSTQPSGAALAVVEGTLIVANPASQGEAKAGEEVHVSTGARFRSGPDTAVTLRLPDQSLLHLAPSTVSQVEDWSPAGNIVLRGLSGTLTLEARSDKTTLKMSTVTSFGLNSLDFAAVPVSDGTVMSMAVDASSVRLMVEQGKANLSINGNQYQAAAGTQVNASPDQAPDIKVPAGSPAAMTGTPTPTEPPTLFTPTPGTASPSEAYPYPAPALLEPENQASIKGGAAISLTWQSVAETNPDQWYEIQLWLDTAAPYTVVGRTQSADWGPLSNLQAGIYRWRIRLIRLSDGAYLSPPSETREFTLVRVSSTSTPVPQPAQLPTLPPTSGSASSYPKLSTLSPANEASFKTNDTITLSWNSVGTLQANQMYEVRLWENGTQWRGTGQTRDTSWTVPKNYNPGRYGWQVAVIVVQDGKWLKDISPQSDMRFFIWEAPPSESGGGGGGKKPPSGPPTRKP